MESISFVDLNKICRVCLEEEELVSLPIFKFKDMVIYICSTVQLDENDGLPQGICNNCLYRLEIAFQFKNLIKSSDVRLRNYLPEIDIDNQVKDPLRIDCSRDDEIYAAMGDVCNFLSDSPNVEEILQDEHPYSSTIPVDILGTINDPTIIQQHVDELNEITMEHDLNEMVVEDQFQELIPEDTQINKKRKNKSKLKASHLNHMLSKHKEKQKEVKEELKEQTKICDDKILLSVPDQCFECGKTFNYSGYLESHLRTHSGVKPFQCNVCHRKFAQGGNLNLHMRTHTNERPYQCEICSKMFTTSSNLSAHQKTHSDLRQYACYICPRAFRSQSELTSHEGTHSGIKNHKCKICGKAFYKTAYVNVHMKAVHIGEKKHKCTECGKYFANSSNLTCHFRIHTGEKPYSCDHCEARFNQSSALIRHKKQHTDLKSKNKQRINSTKITDIKEIDETNSAVINLQLSVPNSDSGSSLYMQSYEEDFVKLENHDNSIDFSKNTSALSKIHVKSENIEDNNLDFTKTTNYDDLF